MGLSVVHSITKQHNGWIDVMSEPNAGTVFKIYLPAATSSVETHDARPPSWSGPAVTGQTVLLVEDDEEVCAFAAKALTTGGYVVFTAYSVAEAMDAFGKHADQIDVLCSKVTALLTSGSMPAASRAHSDRLGSMK